MQSTSTRERVSGGRLYAWAVGDVGDEEGITAGHRGRRPLNRRAAPARVPPRREVGAVAWWAWLLVGWLVLSIVGGFLLGALIQQAEEQCPADL